jgi:hypothetical protein
MMSFLTNITGFFMNFELLPILTDYEIKKKGGMKLKKNLRTALTDTILKGGHLRIISAKFGCDWLSSFRGEDFFNFIPPFF